MTERLPAIRVVIQQSVIPLYSVPLFEGIAATEGITLSLTYSTRGNALSNHQPVGAHIEAWATREYRMAGRTFLWDSAQWAMAGPGACDVLVLEWNAWFLSLLPAVWRARRHGIRTVLWGHGYSKRPSRLRDWLRAVPARQADALLLYESNSAAAWRRAVPARCEVHHAPNSLDDQAIARARAPWLADAPRRDAFRAQHGLSEGNTLLFIGRLYAENDIDFLFLAFARVLAERPDCRLVLIGDDRDEMPRLQRLAQTLGIDAAIRWVGALYEETRIAPWSVTADLFVYPMNVGLSLIHAFNYGLPAVVAGDRRRHNPEIHALRDDVNGVFVQGDGGPDNVVTYAQAIVSLLVDPVRRARLAAGARSAIENEYNMAAMVRGFVGAIRGSTGSLTRASSRADPPAPSDPSETPSA